jgi:hypothetical protein
MSSLPHIRTTQDWHNFIVSNPQVDGNKLLEMRYKCYEAIEAHRKRPLIVYATKFLESLPNTPNFIDLSDIDGFTDLVQSINGSEEIDVLLHSPGGRPDATERIVYILRNKFKRVHFLIPHSAYSAATMLALSGDTITLHPSATLGPIDPQIDGIPARSIKRGFDKVKEIIKQEGPEALPAYIPLIEKYSIHLLELCEDSEKLSKNLVSEWIRKFMLQGHELYENQVEKSVDFFSDYDNHLLHSRPLNYSKLKDLKLNIQLADNDLSGFLWEAYILLNGFFGISSFVKIYESRHGVSWGKQYQQFFIPQQAQSHKQS